jgi:hypothetical protein
MLRLPTLAVLPRNPFDFASMAVAVFIRSPGGQEWRLAVNMPPSGGDELIWLSCHSVEFAELFSRLGAPSSADAESGAGV